MENSIAGAYIFDLDQYSPRNWSPALHVRSGEKSRIRKIPMDEFIRAADIRNSLREHTPSHFVTHWKEKFVSLCLTPSRSLHLSLLPSSLPRFLIYTNRRFIV